MNAHSGKHKRSNDRNLSRNVLKGILTLERTQHHFRRKRVRLSPPHLAEAIRFGVAGTQETAKKTSQFTTPRPELLGRPIRLRVGNALVYFAMLFARVMTETAGLFLHLAGFVRRGKRRGSRTFSALRESVLLAFSKRSKTKKKRKQKVREKKEAIWENQRAKRTGRIIGRPSVFVQASRVFKGALLYRRIKT